MTILLLEDDQNYRESMQEFLESIHAKVDAFENGDDAFGAIYENNYDLLLLDVKVPGKNGYDITKEVRKDGFLMPIILVTSLVEVDNLTIGYDMGCDDYIRKPFSIKELHCRILHALSSSSYKHYCNLIQLPYGFVFDVETLELSKEAQVISLTPIEQKIVDLLVRNRGTFLDRYTIIDHVWSSDEVSGVDLRMHVLRIRTKTDSRLIVSERGKGYKIEKS